MFKNKIKSSILSVLIISLLAGYQINAKNSKRSSKKSAESNLIQGQKFLEENKKKPGIVVRESGLQYKIIKEGEGIKPRGIDEVEVHYHGTLLDGTIFDSSVKRGKTFTFPVRAVIRGWQEGLQLMKEGGKRILYIPSDLAYGEKGAGKLIGPNQTLIFEVEIIKVIQ